MRGPFQSAFSPSSRPLYANSQHSHALLLYRVLSRVVRFFKRVRIPYFFLIFFLHILLLITRRAKQYRKGSTLTIITSCTFFVLRRFFFFVFLSLSHDVSVRKKSKNRMRYTRDAATKAREQRGNYLEYKKKKKNYTLHITWILYLFCCSREYFRVDQRFPTPPFFFFQ